MAEALGVVSSAVQLADVLVRLGRYLNDIYKDAAVIEEYIRDFTTEIERLHDVVVSVRETCDAELNRGPEPSQSPGANIDRQGVTALWQRVSLSLEASLKGVKGLEKVVHAICGNNNQSIPSTFDTLARAHRKRSKKETIRQCRDQIATHQRNLQLLLQTIDLKTNRSFREGNADSFGHLQQELRDIGRDVQTGFKSLEENVTVPGSYEAQLDSATLSAYSQLKMSVDSAAIAITAVSSNEHFDIPVPVRSIYTGRQGLLEEMRSMFIAPPGVRPDAPQRRFVISGIGGSGKTQFCCKFAEENRDSFWGVFWIDASTTERIKQTLTDIARIAKVEQPNETAALYWLSNIKQRWLLLIDNADDPSITLEDYFPVGNRGHILITTRRRTHRNHGNVGPGFYDFEQLEAEDANLLLLRAASKPAYSNANVVTKITKTLSFLALAIIQAGAAITRNMCTFEGYLSFYENSWKKIPRRHVQNGSGDRENLITKVYKSWEANYTFLEGNPSTVREDAIQMLKVFAFLHRENIRFDILRRAVSNVALEKQRDDDNEEHSDSTLNDNRRSWSRTVRALYHMGLSAGSPPPLPRLVREGQERYDEEEAYTMELRGALAELVECSLISYNETKDTYHMHPLQHRYARERLSVAEQGVWAEAAATVLSSAILLPPLGTSIEHQEFNRQMAPHLDHVLRCREMIAKDVARMRSRLWRRWMLAPTTFNRHKALMYGKFSFALMQHGKWEEAEQLLLPVRDFLHSFLGPSHSRSRLVSSALSTALWHLGRTDEATTVLEGVLSVCKDCFGEHHFETLKAKEGLARILYVRGFYTVSRDIQREVVAGYCRVLGVEDETTLKAKDELARAVKWTFRYEDQIAAVALHREAISGLERLHGADNFDVLISKESLARLLADLSGEHLDEAGALIKEVMERRRNTLGKDHPYTLLASVNAAIIKCAQNVPDEAADLLRKALEVAHTMFPRDHIAILMGRTHLGLVLNRQGNPVDAEEVLRDTTERQKRMKARRGDYHPDRVAALIELARSYRLQGKIEASIEICDEAIEGFASWELSDHVLAMDVKEARMKMLDHQELVQRGDGGIEDISEPVLEGWQPWHVF